MTENIRDIIEPHFPAVPDLQDTYTVDSVEVLVTESLQEGFCLLYAPLPAIPNDKLDDVLHRLLKAQYQFGQTNGCSFALGSENTPALQILLRYTDTPRFLENLRAFAATAQAWNDAITQWKDAQ